MVENVTKIGLYPYWEYQLKIPGGCTVKVVRISERNAKFIRIKCEFPGGHQCRNRKLLENVRGSLRNQLEIKGGQFHKKSIFLTWLTYNFFWKIIENYIKHRLFLGEKDRWLKVRTFLLRILHTFFIYLPIGWSAQLHSGPAIPCKQATSQNWSKQ